MAQEVLLQGHVLVALALGEEPLYVLIEQGFVPPVDVVHLKREGLLAGVNGP